MRDDIKERKKKIKKLERRKQNTDVQEIVEEEIKREVYVKLNKAKDEYLRKEQEYEENQKQLSELLERKELENAANEYKIKR